MRSRRWNWNSTASSASIRRRDPGSLKTRFMSTRRGRPWGGDDHPDRCRISLPFRELGGELAPAERRELVVLRLPVVLGVAPLGVEPPSLFQAMERRIE